MIDWIIENYKDICVWITTVIGCASSVVKLTPTTKDDTVLDKVVQVISVASIFNTKKDQATLDKANDR